jgi:hypothetical protein
LHGANLTPTFLLIDALDECTTDLDKLLELIISKSAALPHIKWIVSSRNREASGTGWAENTAESRVKRRISVCRR